MTGAETGRASYRWLTIALLVAAGAYIWYASGQYGRLNDLNQRQLSNAGVELKTAIDTAVGTATRFKLKRAGWEAEFAKCKGNAECEEVQTIAEPKVCDFDDNQPYLDLPSCANDGASAAGGSTNTWHIPTDVQPVTGPTLGVNISNKDDKEGKNTVAFRFRADRLLRELAFPDSFGLIFIANHQGQVLYQDAPGRRRWLRHLRWGEQTFRDGNADRPPSLQLQNVQQLLGGDVDTWNQLRSVSSRTSVQIGGTSHQLYLQPLVLEENQRIDIIIGGAVATRSIFRDALALDTSLVAVLVFLLLLGMSGYPFVKLRFLSPRERFRLRDVTLLYLSTGALLVLVTCGSLALDGYARWQAVADRGLEGLARNLESRFLAEVTEIREELLAFDAEVRQSPVPTCNQWHAYTDWFKGDPPSAEQPAVFTVDTDASVRLRWPRRDVHLRQVAWIQADGRQLWKVTADKIGGRTLVDQRVYFRAVQDGSLFRTRNSNSAFFLGPDRSISDGKFYTFVSMPSKVAPPRCGESNGVENVANSMVVAASGHLLSLDRQPLPAGYGFALINREGRVLYHSDGRLSLRENLYEELSEGAQARAMVYADRTDVLKTRYRERPHRFYLQPVGLSRAGEPTSAGFYLAVFRDTSAERALIGHVFVGGLVGPMLLLLAIYGAGLWGLGRACRHNKQYWSTWLWPHAGLNTVYQWQAAAFAALLLTGAALYITVESLAAFFVIPILTAAIGIGIYWYGSRRPTTRSALSRPGWHTASILLALTCMIVVPSAVLFRLALSHEFAKLILTERAWIVAQKDDALRAARVEARAENYGPSRADRLETARQRYFGCVPAPFDISPRLPELPTVRQPEVLRAGQRIVSREPSITTAAAGRFYAGCVPMSDDASVSEASRSVTLQSIGMPARITDALHPLDNVLPIGSEILARQHFQPREFAYSPDGTLFRPLRASGIAFAGFAIMLALLVYWIRWNTNRLFLAIEEQAPAPLESKHELWSNLTLEKKLVLLQVARERIANPHQAATIKTLLAAGLLQLDPDLRPATTFDDEFLLGKQRELHAQIREWEHVKDEHSWRYVRQVLIASVVALGIFLFVTQPGLQASLVGIATGIAGALTAGLRLREAIVSWWPGRKSDG